MESNVISISNFRGSNSRVSTQAINQDQVLALKNEIETHNFVEVVKDKIFATISNYRFVVEHGIWDGEFEGSEPFTVRVRLKGTDISGYGNNEASAWLRMSATLIDEGMFNGRGI